MRQIHRLPRNIRQDVSQQGISRGRLAEPYDGIGEYVSVVLAGSAVGSAYKARIAAGDFNGGRTFPIGTPVTVLSYHGQLEVLLGNIPGCKCNENFSRDLPQYEGWGTGGLGTWTYPFAPVGGGIGEVKAWVEDDEGVIDITGNTAFMRLVHPDGAIRLPFEAIFEVEVLGGKPTFGGWSGVGGAVFEDYDWFIELDDGATNFATRVGVLQAFMFGTHPNSGSAFGQTDARDDIAPFNNDFNDDQYYEFDINARSNKMYVRFLADNYGIYMRLWPRDGSPEPTTTDHPGLVHPFEDFSTAEWAATGGGKGEAWHVYDANLGGRVDYPWTNLTIGSGGVAGSIHNNQTQVRFGDICIIRGWC